MIRHVIEMRLVFEQHPDTSVAAPWMACNPVGDRDRIVQWVAECVPSMAPADELAIASASNGYGARP